MGVVPSKFVLSGVVLAGGKSRRLGREKALLEIDGQATWRRQDELLAAAGCRQRLLAARAEQTWVPSDAQRIDDAQPECGPLGGLVAALRVCAGTHLLVLAVDLPRLPLPWIERLSDQCADGVGAAGRHGGFFEPLAAIYPRELLGDAEDALRRGKFSLQAVLELAVTKKLIREVSIAAAEESWFENWNEPGDVRSS